MHHHWVLNKVHSVVLAILLCLSFCLSANAQGLLYRYKDDNGRLVLSNTMPPEYAAKGYQVVDSFGRVLHNVLPAATPEQIAERRLQQAAKLRRQEMARRKAEEDANLQRLYNHPDDAVMAKERRLTELDNLVTQKKIEQNDLLRKIRLVESKAANIERSGKTIPSKVLTDIDALQKSLSKLEGDLENYAEDRENIESEFNRKINRLEELKAITSRKIALNSNNLQGAWLILKLNGKPSDENDRWEFSGDKFYQSFGGRRLSPEKFKVAGNHIELGFANINVIEFSGSKMIAELAGFDYVLAKE